MYTVEEAIEKAKQIRGEVNKDTQPSIDSLKQAVEFKKHNSDKQFTGRMITDPETFNLIPQIDKHPSKIPTAESLKRERGMFLHYPHLRDAGNSFLRSYIDALDEYDNWFEHKHNITNHYEMSYKAYDLEDANIRDKFDNNFVIGEATKLQSIENEVKTLKDKIQNMQDYAKINEVKILENKIADLSKVHSQGLLNTMEVAMNYKQMHDLKESSQVLFDLRKKNPSSSEMLEDEMQKNTDKIQEIEEIIKSKQGFLENKLQELKNKVQTAEIATQTKVNVNTVEANAEVNKANASISKKQTAEIATQTESVVNLLDLNSEGASTPKIEQNKEANKEQNKEQNLPKLNGASIGGR